MTDERPGECVALLVDDDHLELSRELKRSCASLSHLVYIGSETEPPRDTIAWDELLDEPAGPVP